MSFVTTNSYSLNFMNKKRLLFDSDALIENIDKNQSLVNKALSLGYECIITSPSIIEVGFGYKEKIDTKQLDYARDIFKSSFNNPFKYGVVNDPAKILVFNPSPNEWFAAKMILIEYLTRIKTKPENIQKLQFDAIIYYSAWNCSATLITNNVRDFVKFNESGTERYMKDGGQRLLPIFTVADLERSFKENVSFPENLIV